jgi:hypothetical protein
MSSKRFESKRPRRNRGNISAFSWWDWIETKPSGRIARVQAEIRIGHLPYTKPERYLYTSLLDKNCPHSFSGDYTAARRLSYICT